MKKSAFVNIVKEMVLEESTRITKKFSKAVEAYKAVEVEMQSLVKDFVAEKDPKKKEDIKNQLKSLTKKKKQAEAAFNAALATEPVKLKESINEGKEVELILSKDENLDRIKKILRTDKKFKDLNLTKWASGQPLGSARGMLVSMYFDDPKERIQDLINTHNIKVANKSMFESVNEAKEKWVVYDTKTKKRLPNAGKTWATMKAADAFAAKQKNAKVASAEFYFDKIQESVNEGKEEFVDRSGEYELFKTFRHGGMMTHIIKKDGKEIKQYAPNLKQRVAIGKFKTEFK